MFTGTTPDDTEEGKKTGLRTMGAREWELDLTARQVGGRTGEKLIPLIMATKP